MMTVKGWEKNVIEGYEFITVKKLPQDVLDCLQEAVKIAEKENYEKLEQIFGFIGGGKCGYVYKLSEDYILKVNHEGFSDEMEDGFILHKLSGVPFIPQVYTYTTDGKYTVVQRIKGVTVHDFKYNDEKYFEPSNVVSLEKFSLKVVEFEQYCRNRDFYPCDLHHGNCMIDPQGNFWIVDVGLFGRRPNHYHKCPSAELVDHYRDILQRIKAVTRFKEEQALKPKQLEFKFYSEGAVIC